MKRAMFHWCEFIAVNKSSEGGAGWPSSSSSSFSSCLLLFFFFVFFFFFCVPQLYLWGSPFLVRFLRMWPFFNPTIEVITFRLCGWCMQGVFLLAAFTRLGLKCQDLLCLCDGMRVCTDWISVYTLIQKSFGGMESEPMLTPRKNPLYWEKILLGGGLNTRRRM